MTKYNTTADNCKAEIEIFMARMSKGFGKVDCKFIHQMILGITKSQSTFLTDIARHSIDKETVLRKSVERLSRNLYSFKSQKLEQNSFELTKELLPKDKLYIVDDSDIVKSCATKMEGLGYVADGSDSHKIKLGYHLNEIAVIDKNKQPLSVSSVLYSAKEDGFESANTITQQSIKNVIQNIGSGTFVFDRGFDGLKLHLFLNKHNQGYIMRAKSSRNIVAGDMIINIEEFAKMLKGKYSFGIKFQSGSKEHLKASFKKITLPNMPHKQLTIVVVYGFSKDDNKPFYLLTNLTVNDKDSCLKIVGAYLTRWKIEEYFKFKKQAFNFEKIRLQSLKTIKNLNLFLSIAINFLAQLCNSVLKNKLVILSNSPANKATFLYYRLIAGLSFVLPFINITINKQKPKTKLLIPKQFDFFYYLRYVKPHLSL